MQGLNSDLIWGLSSKNMKNLHDAEGQNCIVQTSKRRQFTCAEGPAADVSPLPLQLKLPFAPPFALPFTLPLLLPLLLASLAALTLKMCGSRRCDKREAPS